MKVVISRSLSLSKGKSKEKSARSKFLSALMKKFGGELGDSAISAFDSSDREKLVSAFTAVANAIADDVENKG